MKFKESVKIEQNCQQYEGKCEQIFKICIKIGLRMLKLKELSKLKKNNIQEKCEKLETKRQNLKRVSNYIKKFKKYVNIE